MTFFLNPEEQQPATMARQPSVNVVPTWMEGTAARKTAMDIETNSNWRFQGHKNDVSIEAANTIVDNGNIQDIVQFISARGDRVASEVQDLASIQTRDQLSEWAGIGWEFKVADWAAENPDSLDPNLPVTEEQVEEAATERAQGEYKAAQDVINMSPGGVGADLIAGFASALTDARQAPFLVVGGGTGSLMRVMAREAMINASTEAALMPSQFEMAERLEIDDPDVALQLSQAAMFGAMFGGGLELGSRTLRALTGRNAPPEGLPQTPEIIAAIDDIEDQLMNGVAPQDIKVNTPPQPPAPPAGRTPLLLERPLPPAQSAAMPEVIPDAPQAPQSTPARMPNGSRPADRRPVTLTEFVRSSGGLNKADMRGDLEALPQARQPGFLRAAQEVPSPDGGMRAIKTEGGGNLLDDMRTSAAERGYIDQNSTVSDFLDLLARDGAGERVFARSDQDVAQQWQEFDNAKAELERMRDDPNYRPTPMSSREDFLQKVPVEDGLMIDPASGRYEVDPGQAVDMIRTDLQDYLSGRWADVPFRDSDIEEMVFALHTQGGDAEHLVNRIIERELDYSDLAKAEAMTYEDAAGIEPETPYIGREGEAITGRSEQDGRPESGGEVGAGRSFEATDAGQQALIDGVDPVTTRDRLEAQQDAPLSGGDRPADDGLFDVGARSQTDMFSDPVASIDMHRRAGDSIRDQIDELGDLNIAMEAEGRKMGNLTDVMDYLDESDRALARIQLCGGNRT